MLKAALNRAFHTDRVSSDMAWRKVKPFKRVDEAMVRYLSAAEARRLVKAARWRWLSRKRPRAPGNDLKAHSKAGTISPYAVPERWKDDALHHQSRVGISPGVRFAAKPLNRAV
jgi:hypothetical protein